MIERERAQSAQLTHTARAANSRCQLTFVHTGVRLHALTRVLAQVGAQVILVKSVRPAQGLVNGARGIVVRFTAGQSKRTLPVVRFRGGQEHVITREEWVTRSGGVQLASRQQLPLELAWGLSIHKVGGSGAHSSELGALSGAPSSCLPPVLLIVGLIEDSLCHVAHDGRSGWNAQSQGMSLDRAQISLGNVFEYGQVSRRRGRGCSCMLFRRWFRQSTW